MIYHCPHGCVVELGMSEAGQVRRCEKHDAPLSYAKALKRSGPLNRSPGTRRGSPLKRGKGFAVTPEQRRKVRGLPCVSCGRYGGDIGPAEFVQIDPAHLYPRSLCPCDHVEGVIPLCRRCHRTYDDAAKRASLDLLPKLIDRGFWEAIAHPIAAHEVSLLTLLQHVTGAEWQPVTPQSENREEAA